MNFEEIKNFCIKNVKEKELWPTYYERRYQEFLTFYEFMPQKKYASILELGCGIGYYSAFLSTIADQVTATDLEVTDPTTHSPGLQLTRDFLKKLGVSNVTVKHASAEELPFADNSFDMVFSSHVLEHVPDVNKGILEINRVLKPGGINFCVVPTSTDKVYGFFLFYVYIAQRLFANSFGKIFKKNEIKANNEKPKVISAGSRISFFKYFPFPSPHGAYPHYLIELKNWTLGGWKKIITQDNNIKLVDQFGLQSNPLLPLLALIIPRTAVSLYTKSRNLENRLSKNIFIKYLGISTLVITEK